MTMADFPRDDALSAVATAEHSGYREQDVTTVKPQFDPQELAAVEAIDRFAREQLAPNAAALDEAGEFAFRHHQAMAELGLMASTSRRSTVA